MGRFLIILYFLILLTGHWEDMTKSSSLSDHIWISFTHFLIFMHLQGFAVDISNSGSIQIGLTSIHMSQQVNGEFTLFPFGFDAVVCVIFALVRQFSQLCINVDNVDHMIVLYQDVYVSLLGFQSWTMVCSTILIHMESPEFCDVCGVFSSCFAFQHLVRFLHIHDGRLDPSG